MTDKGVYVQLWKKYLPVIRLLLKKTAKGDQKLQMYKHEFEKTGAKNKLGYVFSLELVNGKPVAKSDQKAVAHDLLMVMNENEDLVQFFKDQRIVISSSRACELVFHKVEQEVAPAVAVAAAGN